MRSRLAAVSDLGRRCGRRLCQRRFRRGGLLFSWVPLLILRHGVAELKSAQQTSYWPSRCYRGAITISPPTRPPSFEPSKSIHRLWSLAQSRGGVRGGARRPCFALSESLRQCSKSWTHEPVNRDVAPRRGVRSDEGLIAFKAIESKDVLHGGTRG